MESKKAQNGKEERVPSGYMLSLIGGILIEVPFVLILAPLFTTLFVEAFLSPFFYVPGVVVTILSYFGLLAGILVLIGSWLIKTGRSKAGGIIVIIFSLFSIVSGGGFIVGLVLGVVGGMAGIVGKQK